MNFNYTEQQVMLRTMARDFLVKECPKSMTRELEKDKKGYGVDTWRRVAELGWIGLVLPEQYGGSGAGFMDLVILMEEIGRNILPGPFFSTVALAALPIMEYGSDEQKARYLPPIARGEKIWTLALNEVCADSSCRGIKTAARLYDGRYTLNGEKIFVPYAGAADFMLVVARVKRGRLLEKGLTLFIVDMKKPGIDVDVIPTITGEVQCRVKFTGVDLSAGDVLGIAGAADNAIGRMLDKAGLLKCAEVSGACQSVLDITSDYARDRHQFGKPIGAFQIIQHRLVDMLMDVEGLHYLVCQAAWLMSTGADCNGQLAMAKVKANEVYQRVALSGVKIHGAIGFSREHDIGLYYRRVMASKFFPRDTDYYIEKVARGIGL
ncbi:MAG: acyl-CoA dehydrogenase [Dehalococcoidia bacterium]|nr:MAG: acyl-CoA dehydrogenase [Dehalococcoidia bacterium]